MKRKTKIIAAGCLGLLLAGAAVGFVGVMIYRAMDAAYQESADRIRIKHARQIVSVVFEYAEKTGKFPFEDEAAEGPFMAVIGHSMEAEDAFANEPVLKKGATFTNSSVLEAELSRALGRKVILPRDPQLVTTFAPNVYVYFIAEGQFTVVAHLFSPSDRSVEYEWRGGRFHSHTLSYSQKPEPPDALDR